MKDIYKDLDIRILNKNHFDIDIPAMTNTFTFLKFLKKHKSKWYESGGEIKIYE